MPRAVRSLMPVGEWVTPHEQVFSPLRIAPRVVNPAGTEPAKQSMATVSGEIVEREDPVTRRDREVEGSSARSQGGTV
jgi:hypothetical protein